MNLASFYLCLFKKIKIDSAISWEIEDSYKYLRDEAEVFIHTRLLRENTMTWKSKNNQECVVLLAKIAVYFYFLFPNLNFLSILDMRLMYFIGKTGESSYSA